MSSPDQFTVSISLGRVAYAGNAVPGHELRRVDGVWQTVPLKPCRAGWLRLQALARFARRTCRASGMRRAVLGAILAGAACAIYAWSAYSAREAELAERVVAEMLLTHTAEGQGGLVSLAPDAISTQHVEATEVTTSVLPVAPPGPLVLEVRDSAYSGQDRADAASGQLPALPSEPPSAVPRPRGLEEGTGSKRPVKACMFRPDQHGRV